MAELAHFPKSVVKQAQIKAKELENLGGPGIGSSSEGSGAKHRHSLTAEEDACLTTFLNAFAEGGSANMTQEEMVAHLNATVAKLQATDVGTKMAMRLASP